MARFSNNNKDSKSSGIGSQGGSSTQNTPLTPEQEVKVASLKEDLEYYQNLKIEVLTKRNTIKSILDNFEKIVLGDVILDILPDENSDEILNSVIITKSEILSAINSTQFEDDVKNKLNQLTIKVISSPIVIRLIELSSELNENEIYTPIWVRVANAQPTFSEDIKSPFREIIRGIETDVL